MSKTGMVRRFDELGRVVIPKEIRNKLNLTEGSAVEISVKGNQIIFEKSDEKICNNCGQLLDGKFKYCHECGKEQ